MELAGEYTFNAPRQVVWDAIMDPEVLAKILPGCERLEKVSETEYKGVLNVRIGPVQGRFNGKVLLSDLEEPERFHLDIDGKGAAGFIKGGGDARLDVIDDNTVLTYSGEAQVGGRIASAGQRLVDTSARSIVRQALESLDRIIQAKLQPAPEVSTGVAAPVPEIEPPTQTELALGVAKDLYDEFVPEERRPLILGLVGAAAVLVVVLIFVKLLGGSED
ncbi:MAG TPA: carbon monoxide dehydrogenase subunit G [Caldilineae bacterium]|nr:carbon monoxide dehydrogenase subunit G [Caldilineae bacterium]